VSDKELVHTAIVSLGLNDISEFDPNEKIIEYKIAKHNLLVNFTVKDFVDELASDSPAPGGGSVAALCGSLAAGLTAMVGNLTTGKYKFKNSEERIAYKENEARMFNMAWESQQMKKQLIEAIDKDTEAFNNYMAAMKLPKKTEEDKIRRSEAIQKAIKDATLIPLHTMKLCWEVIVLAETAAKYGNQNALSDAGVSAITALTGLKSAYFNVLINLPGVKDKKFQNKTREEAEKILKQSVELTDKIEKNVLEKL